MFQEMVRSVFKTPSKAQWLCCPAHSNAHVLRVRSALNSRDALSLNLIWDFENTSIRLSSEYRICVLANYTKHTRLAEMTIGAVQ